MKQNKLPGFSLGLIALAVNSAYADIVITPSDDNQHAVIINSDTVNKKVSNSIVYTNSNSSYGVSVSDVGVEATIENSLIVTSGGQGENGITSSAVVSEYGATTTMDGVNIVYTSGDYSAGLLSQVNDKDFDNSDVADQNTIIKANGLNIIITKGKNASGVLACSNPGDNRTCVDEVDDVKDEQNDHEIVSRADLKMTGGIIQTTGDRSYGAYANGEKSFIQLDDVMLATHGEESHAIAIRQGSITFENSLISTEGESASIAKIHNGGTLTLTNVIATTDKGTGLSFSGNINSADVTLSNTQLNSSSEVIEINNSLASIEIGNQSILSSANNVLINNTESELVVKASDSTLYGAALINIETASEIKTDLSLSAGTRWYMSDSSTVTNLTNSESKIYLSNYESQTFDKGRELIVNGDYHGDNGSLYFRTVLNGDDSPTDKLEVKGNTSGSTNVYVTNAGGTGEATINGIELITVGGDSSGVFNQVGRITAGAYEYELNKINKNWYLTNFLIDDAPSGDDDVTPPDSDDDTPPDTGDEDITPPDSDDEDVTPPDSGDPIPNPDEGNDDSVLPDTDSGNNINPAGDSIPVLRPEGGSYIANLAAANTLFLMRLNDRAGKTRYIDPAREQERTSRLWLRQIGGHNAWRDSSGQLKTTSHRYVTQLGADLLTGTFCEKNSWRFGVMGGYARDYNSTHSSISGYRSKGSVRGYSAGLYATWFADEVSKKGAYLDTWAQYSWFKNSVKGDELAYESYSSKGATASIEAGYGFSLNKHTGLENAKYEWIFQPQAQAIWMDVDHNAHTEANGTRVENEASNNIQTRLGFRTFIRTQDKNSGPHGDDFEPFVEMNWIHNSKDFAVSMNGVKVEQEGAKNLGEIKLGVNGNLSPSASVWGNVGVQLGDNGYNDTAVMLGFKYKF